jgi:hypothetical protein
MVAEHSTILFSRNRLYHYQRTRPLTGTPAILRSFNNVNATAIAVTAGSSAGRCTIDFGFDVSDRYIVATAYGTAIARFVTFAPGADNEKWNFYRYDENGTGQTGNIMVLIY